MKKTLIAIAAGAILAAGFFVALYIGLIPVGRSQPSPSPAQPAPDAPAETPDPDEDEPLIHLSPEQARLIRIEVEPAGLRTVDNQLRLQGEIRLNLDETARIMPRLPGFVTAVTVKEGDRVKAGQTLARLTSHKLGEYYSDYNSAVELEELTASEFRMAESLIARNAIAEKEYLRYKRDYADAVIARKRAEALLDSLLLDPAHPGHLHEREETPTICTDYEIRAPFDGTVIAKNITVGENFPEDNTAAVFTLTNLDRLWLELRAGSEELKLLHPGMTVHAETSSGSHFSGKISYISPVIDEVTRTGMVRVLLDTADKALHAGEFATAVVDFAAPQAVLAVPRRAIQLIDGESAVFVPDGDGYAVRPVTTGRSAGGYTEILAGLADGEDYVAEGAFELKSILLAAGMDPHAGHGH